MTGQAREEEEEYILFFNSNVFYLHFQFYYFNILS